MTGDIVSSDRVFKNRDPFTEEELRRLIITGGNGAYRELIGEAGLDPKNNIYLGAVIEANIRGNITGARTVKCGTIPSITLSAEEIWGKEGKVTIDMHDASLYEEPNGMLTSNWTMNIPWRAKLKVDGKWKSVKKGSLKDYGLTELSFRMTFQPQSDRGGTIYIGVVPLTVEELRTRGDAGSRFFPTIEVMDCEAELWLLEEPHHKYGVGVMPVLRFEDACLDQQGEVITEEIVWPASQMIKDKLATLLQASTVPNRFLTMVEWKQSLEMKPFERKDTEPRWPTPRREDEETEEEFDLEDTEGEHNILLEIANSLHLGYAS